MTHDYDYGCPGSDCPLRTAALISEWRFKHFLMAVLVINMTMTLWACSV